MKLTFDRSAAGFVLQSFPGNPKKCVVCGDEVTPDNLAGVVTEVGFVCNYICCLIEFSKILRKRSEEH